MTESKPRLEPFNLGLHTARLLIDEPFFAAFSSRIDKVATTAIPTAAIGVNPTTGHFTMYYNADFVASLPDHQKRGIIKHEFYHLIFDHVTSRAPPDGIKRIHNIAMDLSINGNEGIRKELPREEDPGPMMASGKPMLACMPGEGPFKHLPAGMSYEWYLERLKEMVDEDKSKGKPGEGTGEPQDGDPFGDMDSLDSHDGFGEGDGTLNEIAKERLKEGLKKAAMAAKKSGNWGSISSETRKRIMESIVTTVDWRAVLRGFVQKSQRANKRSNPRRVNRRFRYIHPGKTVRRQARVAISIDQSGSVSDRLLATFFAELENLADIAEFTVIPFDTSVDEKKVYVWKKGEKRPWERVLCGGTCFNAPTDYVNKEEFDGHIVLTDMEAPKPRPSKCQRMWMTTKAQAERPYFQTNERVVPIG